MNVVLALGAGLWTTDLSRAHRVAGAIEAGVVWINCHHRNDPSSPWYVLLPLILANSHI